MCICNTDSVYKSTTNLLVPGIGPKTLLFFIVKSFIVQFVKRSVMFTYKQFSRTVLF